MTESDDRGPLAAGLPARTTPAGETRLPLLLFRIGDARYALDLTRVREVLPLAGLKQMPGAPEYVAGLLDHRGSPVPVVDLCRLSLGRAAERRLGTRIILISHPGGSAGTRPLGLIAEQVTETDVRTREEFVPPGLDFPGGAHLGDVCADPRGILQLVEVEGLLPPEVHDLLFWPHSVEP